MEKNLFNNGSPDRELEMAYKQAMRSRLRFEKEEERRQHAQQGSPIHDFFFSISPLADNTSLTAASSSRVGLEFLSLQEEYYILKFALFIGL